MKVLMDGLEVDDRQQILVQGKKTVANDRK